MRRSFLTLAVTGIACRDPEPPPPPPPAPPHDGVTLIQAGVTPRQPLRYHLAKGARTTSEMVFDIDVKSGDRSGPLPTQVVDLETTVDDVLANGSARLRIRVLDARVRERPGSQIAIEAVRAQAAALRGVVITQTLAADGEVSDPHVEPGPGSERITGELDSLLRGLGRVAMRLPVEPVGVGALWRERRTLPEGGVQAVSETTYVLGALAGSTVAYTSAGQSSGDAQTVEREGMKVQVSDTRGRTSATGSVDLATYAFETRATSTFSTTMAVDGSGPGAGRSTIEIAMAIRIGPPPTSEPAGSDQAEPAAAAARPAALRPSRTSRPSRSPRRLTAHTARRSACTSHRRPRRTRGAARRPDRTCSGSTARRQRPTAGRCPRRPARTACRRGRWDRTCTRRRERTARRSGSTSPPRRTGT
jgi:hypothetical protein